MIFSDDFFDKLPSDLNEALEEFVKAFVEFDKSIPIKDEREHYGDYVDAYFAAITFIKTNGLFIDLEIDELIPDDMVANIDITKALYRYIAEFLKKLKNNTLIESSKFKYESKFNSVFSYKFTDGDLKRIQELINELRDQINESELLTSNHKERLLKRLERLQLELNKRMSNLDKFWGLLGDAGVVLGKFGADAKPFVDRIKEIAEIVWRAQAMAEELPSGTSSPMLK